MNDAYHAMRMACLTNPLREPVLAAAIQALQLPPGSHGLDLGCGIGLQALMLADAIGPDGRVTGVDLSADVLMFGESLAKKAGMSERITYQEGDGRRLPFDDDTFDWAWSVDFVGYAPTDPMPLIRELARVVKPGGRLAILAWSHETLLPGYPLLEARLKATRAGLAPFVAGQDPAAHFMRGLGSLREAGLEARRAQTFVGDVHAPLTADLRDGLTALFQMRWSGVEPELSPEDLSAFQRLCLPESPEFILNQEDYYAFFTYSMFSGTP